LANTNRQNSDKEADIARLTGQLQQVQARVARLEEQIREIGSVDELLATAQGLESGIQESDATIASRQQTLAIATNRLADLTSTIRNYQELEGRQRSGRLTDDFQARIASVVPTWGFVILDRGNLAGAYTNATLDVRRGNETVGKLRIGNVEQQVAFADVLPGTFAEGDTPRQGDLVVPAAAAADMAPDAQGGFGLPDMQQPVPVPGIPDMPAGEFGDPGAAPDAGADGDSIWNLLGEDGEQGNMPPAPEDGQEFSLPDNREPAEQMDEEEDVIIVNGQRVRLTREPSEQMNEEEDVVIDLGDLTEEMMNEEEAPIPGF
jgi:hypothetical protein